ncbi:MAG: sigma-54-dependent Fis family transcriptional regulator, partial [Thiohalocapsa sp.]|nr:sigma-54-dependent Fis family transcriptional regulator [Thiohalocapsa sp.]
MADPLLIIEDDTLFGRELARHFKGRGWDADLAASLKRAKQVLLEEHAEPLVIIADMSLPDGNALDLLEQARAQNIPGEWILLTGCGSVPDSVR